MAIINPSPKKGVAWCAVMPQSRPAPTYARFLLEHTEDLSCLFGRKTKQSAKMLERRASLQVNSGVNPGEASA